MASPRPPSPAAPSWLEEALSGWPVPLAVLGALAVAGALDLLGAVGLAAPATGRGARAA